MKRVRSLEIFIFMFIALSVLSCNDDYDPVYRDRMRNFVQEISDYSREIDSGFIIIPQNGHELVSVEGEANNDPHSDYLESIDGAGQEDLFFGYSKDDRPTDEKESEYLLKYLIMCEENGVEVLVTDYCSTSENVDRSYELNSQHSFISFAADDRELSTIPTYPAVYNLNINDVTSLMYAKNFLYLINPVQYTSKNELISALATTDYDVIIIDLFFNETQLDFADVEKLKTKNNGGKRLVICYMSIGEAENYRYYWNSTWDIDAPDWLLRENPKWEGNFRVEYWNREWKSIIYGNSEAYLDRILSAGFDGAYLDIIEAFEYFE